MNTPAAPYTVLITGASSGIGYELARHYLQAGARVLALARSEKPLAQLAQEFPGACLAVKVDLTDALDCQRASDWIGQHIQHLDLAIINAGTCEYVDVAQLSITPFNNVMAINWQGAINTLLLCLPLLRAAGQPSKRAQLVGISSMATLLPMPRSQAYGASKAALEYLLESLRVDLAKEPIDITIVRPGFVKTPLTARNDFPMPFAISASEATAKIVAGIGKRQWLVQFPWPLVWLMTAVSVLPLRIKTRLLQMLSRA